MNHGLLEASVAVVWSLSNVQLFANPWTIQRSRLPCPSLSPGVCSYLCPLSWWCHPTISSSVIPFSSCSQSFPASGSFQMSQLFASGGQSIGASASALIFSMNIQGWFPLGLTGLISLQSKGPSRVFSNTTVQKHQFFSTQPSFWSNSHFWPWTVWKANSTSIKKKKDSLEYYWRILKHAFLVTFKVSFMPPCD